VVIGRRHRVALLALLLLVGPAQALFEASVDRRVIDENDVVVLELRRDTQVFVGNPDLSGLEQDFRLLGTQRASQFTIAGGRTQSLTTWTITLQPLRRGTLAIPSIEYDGERTEPIAITVTAPTPDEQASLERTLFFETEVSRERLWVQEQIVYTVRLYYAADAVLFGDLPPAPQLPNAVVRPLGDSRPGSETRDGVRYNLVEQRYAVVPQRSGTLRILPEVFTGAVRMAEGGRTRRKNVRIESSGHELEVRAQPDSWPADKPWLPARALTLEESWSPTPPALRAGEPVTRTLTLAARGVAASTLPELDAAVPDGARAYPGQPALEEKVANGDYLASRVEATVLIPASAGTLTIPEVRVPWWDVERDELRVAVVPARRLTVAAGTGAPGDATLRPDEPPAQAEQAAASASPGPGPGPTRDIGAFDAPWRAVALALLLLWILTMAAWGWRRRQSTLHRPADAPRVTPPSLERIRAACTAGDGAGTADALRRWRDAPETDAGLREEIDALLQPLDRALYGAAATAPDLAPIQAWLRKGPRRTAPRGDERGALPPLHPAD
jgi:hypothetical protein